MATTGEYDAARRAVESGHYTPAQLELVQREATQAGWRGSLAREALRKANLA